MCGILSYDLSTSEQRLGRSNGENERVVQASINVLLTAGCVYVTDTHKFSISIYCGCVSMYCALCMQGCISLFTNPTRKLILPSTKNLLDGQWERLLCLQV